MEDKGVFKMKGMDNSREKLEKSLMEVTGGAAKTDLIPTNGKNLKLIPKPDFDSNSATCIVCNKKCLSSHGEVPKGYSYVCSRCRERMRKELPSQIMK